MARDLLLEAAKESSEEVIKVLKRKFKEQDKKIPCLEKRQETDNGNNSSGREREVRFKIGNKFHYAQRGMWRAN